MTSSGKVKRKEKALTGQRPPAVTIAATVSGGLKKIELLGPAHSTPTRPCFRAQKINFKKSPPKAMKPEILFLVAAISHAKTHWLHCWRGVSLVLRVGKETSLPLIAEY